MRAKPLFLSAALLAMAHAGHAQPGPGQVDTTGVWYHLRHNNRPAAQAELERLKDEHPDWQPSQDILQALEGKAKAPSKSVTDKDAYARRVDAAESAIRGDHIDPKAIEALAADMRPRKDANGAERIGRALLDHNRPELARGWMERAVGWSRPGSQLHKDAAASLVRINESIAQGQAAEAEAGARRAAAAGNWSLAEQLASIAQAGGSPRIRTDLGWAALNAKDPARAAGYFAAGPQNEESHYGRALALGESHAGPDRLASACGPEDRSDRIAQACGDAFAALALSAYESGQWDQVLALDATARGLGLARPGTGVLAGWSLFRKGDYQSALQRFDGASADPAAAEGIAQSLMALGRYDELEQRAGTMPALAEPYRKQVGDLAVIRHRPALAASVGAPGTAGIEAPSMTAGFYDRDKSGGIGADKIEEQGAALTLKTVLGRDILSAGLETAWVHNGLSSDNATLATPWMTWERQAVDSDLSATLGTSPIGGAVSALPALSLAGEKDWSGFIGTGAFKVQPRYDSLLSMAGQRDATTGTSWGRVVEIGPQIGGILLAGKAISVSGSVAYGSLQGHDVAANDHVAATLSASYTITLAGFDYLRVGPAYAYDAFSRNQFFFTPGYGGYYSPQASHAPGLFADFLTDQGKSWLIGGRVNGSWQYSRQAAEGTFGGVSQTELGTDSTLRGSVLLGRGIILGAFGRVTISPSGRDKAAGLTVTVPLDGREGLFADDLPHFIDRAWP
jgi:tetratricopeptide (TPR) repeat protein